MHRQLASDSGSQSEQLIGRTTSGELKTYFCRKFALFITKVLPQIRLVYHKSSFKGPQNIFLPQIRLVYHQNIACSYWACAWKAFRRRLLLLAQVALASMPSPSNTSSVVLLAKKIVHFNGACIPCHLINETIPPKPVVDGRLKRPMPSKCP
jgi:hypothetical protein